MAVGLALVQYGREEAAEGMVEQMTRELVGAAALVPSVLPAAWIGAALRQGRSAGFGERPRKLAGKDARRLPAVWVHVLGLPLSPELALSTWLALQDPRPAVWRHVCAGPRLLRHLQQRRHPKAAALCGVRCA